MQKLISSSSALGCTGEDDGFLVMDHFFSSRSLRKLGFSLTNTLCSWWFCSGTSFYFHKPFPIVQGVNRNLLNAVKIHFVCCGGCSPV